MNKYFVLFALLFSSNVFSGMTKFVVAYSSEDIPVASFMNVSANFVAMPVMMSSESKEPSERLSEIKIMQKKIQSSVLKVQGLDYQQGVVSLSPSEKSSFSFSKSYGFSSGVNFYLLSEVNKDVSVYDATQKIYKFIEGLKVPENIELEYQNTRLAIKNPDAYKGELLKGISDEVREIKQYLGNDFNVTVTGLDSPVMVMQKSDKEVSVFINYGLVLEEFTGVTRQSR